MTAQEAPGPAVAPQRTGDTVIHPRGDDGSAEAAEVVAPRERRGWGSWGFAGLVGTAGAAYWWWWRRRQLAHMPGSGASLVVEQTRSLGNRQYLVVAACDGRRFLLGVTPGQINRLADLDDPADGGKGDDV